MLADKTGEQFLVIQQEMGDDLIVQFITNDGLLVGQPFKDKLSGLVMSGWRARTTSTAIGLAKFKQGITEDAEVSFALHRLYPLGRKIRLTNGDIASVASYANTHNDGYYMYVRVGEELKRIKLTPQIELLPSEVLLRLPYYPAPLSQEELDNISDFDAWAAGF